MPENKEELYRSIYTHDVIYVPPHEETSAPLEVSLGCSWHKCTFCDFAKDTFQIHPLEKIEHNLKVLATLQPDNKRIFWLGENPFCIPTDYMLQILDLQNKYMPNITEFAMYSRIDDIQRKSDADLALLKERGLSALHIGVESGSDSILLERKKGITAMDTVMALKRLDRFHIDYYLTIIPGLGGRTFSKLHALETANMLNKVHPKNIWCLKLHLFDNTPLSKEAKQGMFDMMTPLEILLEEKLLLSNLNVKDCLFEDTTVLDSYTIRGNLPKQKEELLHAMNSLIDMHR